MNIDTHYSIRDVNKPIMYTKRVINVIGDTSEAVTIQASYEKHIMLNNEDFMNLIDF